MSGNKKYDIVALGEILIDFTPHGTSAQGNALLEVNPGGAPCNVLAMAAKLGAKTAFIGKVGGDAYGRMLKGTAEAAGINTEGMLLDDSVFTTLAFVHLDESGDRSFSFCRKPGADTMLRTDEVRGELVREAKIFHFGTLSMTDEPAKSATRSAAGLAKENGALISFDPNYRPLLWSGAKEAKEAMAWGFAQCDILKISDDELELATGEGNVETGAEQLAAHYPNIRLMFVTMGAAGCYFRFGELRGKSPAFPVKTIDTTGAGDTFMGCCLYEIARLGLEKLDKTKVEAMTNFANGAASLITTRKGAICSMPERVEILALMEQAR